MVMRCPRYNRPCFAIECNGLGACWIEQLEAEQKQMTTIKQKISRMCPSLGIYCYIKECCEADECKSIKRSAQALVEKVFREEDIGNYGPIGSDPSDLTGKATRWICPTDKQPCEMISCNSGESCYVESQRGKDGGTSMTGYNSGGKSYTTPPPCHEGMHSLGFIEKAEIMVGRESSAKYWDQAKHGKIGLIIGLLGDAYPQGNMVGLNDKAKSLGLQDLLVQTPIVPNIWLRWPDYGIVPFDRAWWDKLLGIISKVDGAVLIYCMGGHGRTGTAAAILCSLAGLVWDGADPVAWVRNKYCHKAVESGAQLDYIELITGRKVLVEAAKDTTYSSWTGSGSTHTYVPKKKAGGGGGKTHKTKPDPCTLSKRGWKKWWRKIPKGGMYNGIADVTRVSDIPDGQVFEVGKRHWRWSISKDQFEDVTPKEQPK